MEPWFQSTPPARGATKLPRSPAFRQLFQSTPPARGATKTEVYCVSQTFVSIHTPREGGDQERREAYKAVGLFQSTPPARGATTCATPRRCPRKVSIHTPREGGDFVHYTLAFRYVVSIHTPREGGDIPCKLATNAPRGFNPHPPRGGRRRRKASLPDTGSFNPHPPRGGRLCQIILNRLLAVSIHTPREGGDVCINVFYRGYLAFQSTPPARGATAEITEKTPEISAMCITQFHFCTKVHKVQEKKCI